MKKFVSLSALLSIVAILVLLIVGSVAAQSGSLQPIPGEPQPELEIIGPVYVSPSLRASGSNVKKPEGTVIRINFKKGGQEARRGLYIVQETGGKVLASWYAIDGWTDSGWFHDVGLSSKHVKLQVLYYPGPNTTPTVMKILNHSPNSSYGWATRGIRHAIEVAWPE